MIYFLFNLVSNIPALSQSEPALNSICVSQFQRNPSLHYTTDETYRNSKFAPADEDREVNIATFAPTVRGFRSSQSSSQFTSDNDLLKIIAFSLKKVGNYTRLSLIRSQIDETWIKLFS